jgi:hypothetical protein
VVDLGSVPAFLIFAMFVVLFWVLARREGVSAGEWLQRRNRESFTASGWWKPFAAGLGLLAILAVASWGVAGVFVAAVVLAFGSVMVLVLGSIGRRL